MISAKYSHLKLQRLADEYKYVLFENTDQFNHALSALTLTNTDFFSFSFLGEKSIICSANSSDFPALKVQDGWLGFKIVGEMPFGTVQGLIATISSSLMKEEIGVCIVSTFKTDLFLIKKTKAERAMELLLEDGWGVSE